MAFVGLLLFGYEFNFFYHLITFKKGAVDKPNSSQGSIQARREEFEKILDTIKTETDRLVSTNTMKSSEISCMALQSQFTESSDMIQSTTNLDLLPIEGT